tara:strand:- start:86 stop:403 length:318 start_codon:yes stop_codon:yes gene_type:complete
MRWESILKTTWYVQDGDAPMHDTVHELLFFMAYNEDPKIKQAGEALLNKFDKYYESVEDKDKLNMPNTIESYDFRDYLKTLSKYVTSKMRLRTQYLYLLDFGLVM